MPPLRRGHRVSQVTAPLLRPAAHVLVALLSAGPGQAQNGGPLRNVTDLTPIRARCHSSVGRERLRLEPEAYAGRRAVVGGTMPLRRR